MSTVSPGTAADLARNVYLVQSETLLPAFLKNKVFSENAQHKSVVKGTVGTRLINRKKALRYAPGANGPIPVAAGVAILSCCSAKSATTGGT